MPARVFATLQDYRDLYDDQAAVIPAAEFVAASRRVSRATTGALYDYHSTTGMPLNAEVLEAFQEATCAVVHWRQLSGAATELAAAGLKAATIGDARYEGSDTATVDSGALPLEAHHILVEAGLVGGPVVVIG